MNKKNIGNTALILLSLTLQGCPMGDDIPGLVPTVYLENNSEHGIVPCWNYQATYYIPDMIVFSDTLLPTQYYDPPRDALPVEEGGPDSVAMNNPLLFILEPSEKSYVECFEGDDPLGELFSYLPHDTLSVFVLHADTVRKYSWDEIRNSYNIVVRYDLSEEDVRSFEDNTIPFPPTESMRNMKMWPPYEEVKNKYK